MIEFNIYPSVFVTVAVVVVNTSNAVNGILTLHDLLKHIHYRVSASSTNVSSGRVELQTSPGRSSNATASACDCGGCVHT